MSDQLSRPSRIERDVLTAIVELCGVNDIARTHDLLSDVSMPHPMLGRVLGKLARRGWIVREGTIGARMTPAGASVALAAIRRVRIIELYLNRVLDIGLSEVRKMADHLDPIVTPSLEASLVRHLGALDLDPFGRPIPSTVDDLVPRLSRPLSQFQAGQSVALCDLCDDDSVRIRRWIALRLLAGSIVQIVAIHPLDGIFQFQICDGIQTTSIETLQGLRGVLAEVRISKP